MRPFADPNDRYSYEEWMNDMATRDVDRVWRVVRSWRGRRFVYLSPTPEAAQK